METDKAGMGKRMRDCYVYWKFTWQSFLVFACKLQGAKLENEVEAAIG